MQALVGTEAMRKKLKRFLGRKLNVEMPTDAQIRKECKEAHVEYVAGEYVAREIKKTKSRDGKEGQKEIKIAGQFLHVAEENLFQTIHDWLLRLQEQGFICYTPNIPAGVLPIDIQMDRGGESTKVVAKALPCLQADSVRHCLLLGILDKAKDSRPAIAMAFGPLWSGINAINGCLMYVPVRHVPLMPAVVAAMRVRGEDGSLWRYEFVAPRADGRQGVDLRLVPVVAESKKRKR